MGMTDFWLEASDPVFPYDEKELVDELLQLGMKFEDRGAAYVSQGRVSIQLSYDNPWHALNDLVRRIGPVTFRPLAAGTLFIHGKDP